MHAPCSCYKYQASRRFLSSLGGSSLYPRPPFSAEARTLAGAIDSWLDFSSSSVARALAQWQDAGSEKASSSVHVLTHALTEQMRSMECTASAFRVACDR